MSRRRSQRPLPPCFILGAISALLIAATVLAPAGDATPTASQSDDGQTLALLETPALATVVPARWQRPPRPQPEETADRCAGRYRVAVIDMFYPGDYSFASRSERDRQFLVRDAVDVDGDGVRDPYYHGDIVSLYADHPAIEIVPYNVGNLTTAKEQIARHLAKIQNQVARGTAIDAILLAWESSTLISSLDSPVRLDHAAAYKARLREWRDASEDWRSTYEIVNRLERLTAMGVAVFTIAGNTGPRMINVYTLADGVTAVGAAEGSGEADWSGRNAFVDMVAPAIYHVRLVRGGQSQMSGYDLNEDGVADVPLERVSSFNGRRHGLVPRADTVLWGSSYAAATAVKRHFAGASAQCTEHTGVP
ncbi:MAG: hypothetical protein PVF51_09325 [Nitrospirota bacterium]